MNGKTGENSRKVNKSGTCRGFIKVIFILVSYFLLICRRRVACRLEKINVVLFLNVSWPLVFGDLNYRIVGKSIIAALFSGFTFVVILIG